jgi:hypothetical protein
MTEKTKRDLPTDLVEAEALQRADESRASVMRRKAGKGDAYASAADDAAKDAKESSDHYEKLRGEREGLPRDLSGVSRGLSDSVGNFAPNVDVLTAGGTGVEASNTNVDTGEQAKTADEAGTTSQVEIPADWEAAHWRTRVSMAEKISGKSDLKVEDANPIIVAEIARRG